MKRFIPATVLVLLCMLAPTSAFAHGYGVKRYLTKETTVDMKGMNHVCVGWVDLAPDQWAAHGYDTKAEWVSVIDGLNAQFIAIERDYFLCFDGNAPVISTVIFVATSFSAYSRYPCNPQLLP